MADPAVVTETVYFRGCDSDGFSAFEATGTFNGKCFGIAQTNDPDEIAALRKRQVAEITFAEYNEAKKNLALRDPLGQFRHILESHQGGNPLVAPPVVNASRPTVETAIAARPIPKGRR